MDRCRFVPSVPRSKGQEFSNWLAKGEILRDSTGKSKRSVRESALRNVRKALRHLDSRGRILIVFSQRSTDVRD